MFVDIPTIPTQMVWDIYDQSTNINLFVLNADSTITYVNDASFNFISTVKVKSNTGNSRVITFSLVDTATETIIGSEQKTVNYQNGMEVELAFNTLLTVGRNGLPSAPLTMRVDVSCDGAGYSLLGFNSILASSNAYDFQVESAGSILDFETAML